MNFPPELCQLPVGSDSSVSDNHTCQREAEGRFMCTVCTVCVCVCVHSFEEKRGSKVTKVSQFKL